MERRPQRGTNRGRSGMVARSTDGHKTNASLGAEHLERVGMVMLEEVFLFEESAFAITKKVLASIGKQGEQDDYCNESHDISCYFQTID